MTISLEVKSTQTRNRFNRIENDCIRVHNNKYDYSKAVFVNMKTKFTVICPEHGEFQISPDKHISRKQGCVTCSNKAVGDRKRKSFEWFVAKAHKVHKSKYSYDKNTYVDTKHKITISCPHHGNFEQKPDNHLQGHTCPTCADKRRRAKYLNDPTTLYYIYFPGYDLYKVGITLTSNGVRRRLDSESIKFLIIEEQLFQNGKEAYDKEQALLMKYKHLQYKGEPILKKGGNTELFIKDIRNE